MKKLRTAFFILVILACLPGIFYSARQLPRDNGALVAEKYAGWSGVLRIWAFEGWTGGDLAAGWVNRCAAAFEKSHNGVYIEVKYVQPDAVRDLGRTGVRAPDMILFPPGLLETPDGLAPLENLPVRGDLLACGQGFAAPVALGGYGWAVNAAAVGTGVPADEPWRRWSAAAARLGDPGAVIEETEFEPPGIDLGLPASSTAADPLKQFMNGELGAVCVTQRELVRLSRLSDQGRGPDWTLRPAVSPWTDQVLYLAVPEGGGERQSLAMEFLDHLLTEECQQLLARSNLFTVLASPTGYAGGSALARMDQALRSTELTPAGAFAGISPNEGSEPPF